jgi:hypothetical protein
MKRVVNALNLDEGLVRMERPMVKQGEHRVDMKRRQEYKADMARVAAHRAAKLQTVRARTH